MTTRITLRRRKSYNTRSNRTRKVRTPGGKLVVQYRKKHARPPVCRETGKRLNGIVAARPYERRRIPKRRLTVSRTYGGVLSGEAVRQR